MVRLGRPHVTTRDLDAFQHWLETDPAHLEDYETVKALAAGSRDLKSSFTAELATIARAPNRRRARWRGRAWSRPAFGAAALATVVAAVVLLPSLWRLSTDPMAGAEVLSTSIGEIRDLTLSDGSRLTLDTNTRLSVQVNAASRRLRLEQGQVFFSVAHDAERPFKVALADRTVVVTGTQFTTALIDGSARVSLLEGAVTLEKSGVADARLTMAPGEALRFKAGEAIQREPRFNPATAAEWRSRRRVFLDMPLSEVLADLSRYSVKRLEAADPAVARMRVTAVVPLDGEDSIESTLGRVLPVSVAEVGSDRLEVRAEEHRKPVIRLE